MWLFTGARLTTALATWAQLLWKHSKGAVALRLRYLQQCEGAEARSVLVQDIPGLRPPLLSAQGCPSTTEHLLRHVPGVPTARQPGRVSEMHAHTEQSVVVN